MTATTVGTQAGVPAARAVLPALAVAALFELLVLRMLTRTAIFIPGIGDRIGLIGMVGELSRLVYSVSVVLVAASLSLLVVVAARRSDRTGRTVAVGLSAFAIAAATARLGWLAPGIADAITVGTLVLLIGAAIASRRRPMAFAAVAIIGAALVLAAIDGLWRNLSASLGLVMSGATLLVLAEWLLFAAALAVVAVHRRASRVALAVGAALGGTLLVAAIVAPASLHTLLLWSVGLPGALPAVAYGVIGMAVGTALASAVLRRQSVTAAGIVVLVAGGIGLHSTYQSGLVLVALAAFSLSDQVVTAALAAVDRRPAHPSPGAASGSIPLPGQALSEESP